MKRLRNPRYVWEHPLAFTVGFVAAITGLVLAFPGPPVVDPSSLGEWIPTDIQPLWPILHAIGGFAVVWGVILDKPKYEAGGFALLAVTCAFDAAAVFVIRGVESGIPAGTIVGSVALGCAARSYTLIFRPSLGPGV